MSVTMNKLANCKNIYQGATKKVLCICSAGLLRSPTAAKVLAEKYGYNTRAAGITTEYALIDMSSVLYEWADEIVVMEGYMLSGVALFGTGKPIVSLNISDSYRWNDPALVKEIEGRYEEWMQQH